MNINLVTEKFNINLFTKEIKNSTIISVDTEFIREKTYYPILSLIQIGVNNQVFLFNGWSFVSSPTLQSIDHPVYDLWITSCENI